MRNLLYILSLLCSCILHAQTPQQIFAEANEAYKNDDYKKAIQLNESLVTKGKKTATVYYNLANAYFKNGNLGKAILNYERAGYLAPTDEDVKHNLSFARTKAIDKIQVVESFDINGYIKNLLSHFSSRTWALVSIGLLWLAFIGFLVYLFYANHRGKGFFVGVSFLIFSGFFLIAAQKQAAVERKCGYAIVTQESIYVKSAPDDSSTDIFQLHEGTKVQVLDRVDEFIKIKIVDGRVGWINRDEATRI